MRLPTDLAAFEVGKGERGVPLLGEAEVASLIDPATLLDALGEGFRALADGLVQSPPRPEITVPDAGFSLAMSAWRPGAQICVKVVNVFASNLEQGLPTHLAMIALFDPETGAPTCIMDGTFITGVRTAACAVLSARLLSRAESRVATVIGAGVQAREHLRMLPLIRGFERINIYSLVDDHAVRLAARSDIAVAVTRTDLEAAVRESDVVCLATHAPTPVIDPEWVRPGTHVSSVGYHPPHGELPPALARDNRLFVEHQDALEPTPVGCAELAGLADAITLGDVVSRRRPGRRDDAEITVYKAMGIGMEDLVTANLAYEQARQEGLPAQTMRW